jgi:hypothetical protein
MKIDFLKNKYIATLRSIAPDTPPAWGKMNFQQMVEHMSDSFRIANGKDPQDCITPEEHLPKMQAFIMSDKPFRENTVNPQLPETPPPVRFDRVEDAIGELQQEIDDFFEVFDQDKHKIITNPIFGDLNYEHWVHLLYKHAIHHLRQFSAGNEFN